MKVTGFYCRIYGKDCFIQTNQSKRTYNLALNFINKVQNKINEFRNVTENDIQHVKQAMRNATFEVKTINKGNFSGLSYYEINGENFSYGCDACGNPMEQCIFVY